ncbi:MAG: hypothetical protein ACK50A_03365 [Sphingobacteriaceae bacterium]
MENYSLLISICITHNYFSGLTRIPGLILEPDESTLKILDKLGLVFQPTDEGYNIYYNTTLLGESEVMMYFEKKLNFLLFTEDNFFSNYSLLPPYTNSSVFYLTNAKKKTKVNSPIMLTLSSTKYIGSKDLASLIPSSLRISTTKNRKHSTPILSDIFGTVVTPSSIDAFNYTYNNLSGAYVLSQEGEQTFFYANSDAYKKKPLAVVELNLYDTKIAPAYTIFGQGQVIPKKFNLSFDARAALWRYYVVNKTNTKVNNLSMVSINNKIMFVNKGETTMFNFPTSIFISKVAIKMQDFSDSEINLTLKGSNGNNILENILVPSAESLKTENKINFTDAYIYI